MIIIKRTQTIKDFISEFHLGGKKIGFVPTMGALHDGHISLIKKSKSQNSLTICSIYVNPTQFNNVIDLNKYPVTLESDIDKLEMAACDVLFLPSTDEMYLNDEVNEHYDLGMLEHILEGKYRPGHFQGVCTIVDKLLKAIKPNTLYLGKKDYQQCMVINKMISDKKYEVRLEICNTIREPLGLAMSSRNLRLNEVERIDALKIIEILINIKKYIKPGNLEEIKIKATKYLTKNGYKVDYTEIADAATLEIVSNWDGKVKLVALVAAYLNNVRLIDNMIL
jgi:pantoate--beta-alanine ligase